MKKILIALFSIVLSPQVVAFGFNFEDVIASILLLCTGLFLAVWAVLTLLLAVAKLFRKRWLTLVIVIPALIAAIVGVIAALAITSGFDEMGLYFLLLIIGGAVSIVVPVCQYRAMQSLHNDDQ